jgi:membrane protease YdiL (CAAX protease family)
MKKIAFAIKAWPVITLATLFICFATQSVAKLFGIELPDQANLALVKNAAGFNLRFLFLVLQIVVLLPTIEELIFRLPLRLFRKAPKATNVAAVAVLSALFSAAHYIFQPFPDAAFIALFFFGAASSWLYLKSGTILTSIVNHALFNLTNLVLLFVIPSQA